MTTDTKPDAVSLDEKRVLQMAADYGLDHTQKGDAFCVAILATLRSHAALVAQNAALEKQNLHLNTRIAELEDVADRTLRQMHEDLNQLVSLRSQLSEAQRKMGNLRTVLGLLPISSNSFENYNRLRNAAISSSEGK